LSKIVREHMPWIKIIILSGYNEFDYAQSAVKLGVTEYLLKPVSAKDLYQVLENLYSTLDREQEEREKIKNLQDKNEGNLVFSREKFLLKLVTGGISSADAIEQSQQLGLDIIARYYLVVLIRIELCERSQPFDYHEYQRVEIIVSEFAGNNFDVFVTKKDLEELVLLIKGDSPRQLVHEVDFLTDLIKNEVETQTSCTIVVEIGSPQNRLGDIHHSFAEALVKSKAVQTDPKESNKYIETGDLLKINHGDIENYLKFGTTHDFDEFFSTTLLPMGEIALKSDLMKHYLFVDIILTITQFVSDLGGDIDKLVADVNEIENMLNQIKSIEQIKTEMTRIFTSAVTFRNSQANHERALIVQQAKAYIDNHFVDPELKMNLVALKFNISPSHFSTIFHQEIGVTFRDYIGKLRINRAKELLRTTNLKCSDVGYKSGFNDSHYFSHVFKKKTGLPPRQFREQDQDN